MGNGLQSTHSKASLFHLARKEKKVVLVLINGYNGYNEGRPSARLFGCDRLLTGLGQPQINPQAQE
jgi:hypothetical protein